MLRNTFVAVAATVALSGAGLTTAEAAQPTTQASRVAPHSAAALKCARYPASVVTTTHLRLRKHVVHRHERNKAIVHVRSQVGTPRGHVRLRIWRTDGNGNRVLVHRLHGGVARISILRNLPRGHYAVRAKYIPRKCSKWMRSRSGIRHFRVIR